MSLDEIFARILDGCGSASTGDAALDAGAATVAADCTAISGILAEMEVHCYLANKNVF
jgi:hypothetical protein